MGAFTQDPPYGKPSMAASAMSTESSKMIGTKVSFQMNQALMCETMMAAFVLDAMPVDAVFQSTLSNYIVA
ncbi:hypothetical protein TNCV_4189271 [Trichonephila clavipes]|nr:hypothetical protein TNCV_4189271 [Trichonephila clavipes]